MIPRSLTLTPGAGPVLFTEYAPDPETGNAAVIINTAVSDGLVWLSPDSTAGDGHGIPLHAGTSVPWSKRGQIWAVLDSSATAPVTLNMTDHISDWQPSPVAIAAATAAQLLAGGIPLVYTNTQLAATLVASGGSILLPTTQYASLSIEADPNGGANPTVIGLQWGQSSTPGNLTGHSITETLTSIDTAIYPHWVIPVIGGWVRITNNGAGTIALSVYGSNRPVQRVSQLGENFNARQFSASIVNPNVPGTFYPLTAIDGGADSTVFNGPVLVVCYFNGIAGITQGYVGESFTNNAGTPQTFAGGPYGSAGTFTFNHPGVPVKWSFDPTTTGTGTLNVSILVIPQTPG